MATSTTTASKSRAAKAAPAEAPVEETTAPAAATEAAPKQETESQKRNRLRNEAERIIINRHKPEFEEVAVELFAKNGLKFNKRMSEEDKAKAKIEELIKANPSLRDVLLAQLAPAQQQQPAAVASAAPVEYAPAVAYTQEPEQAPVQADYSEQDFRDPWAGAEPVEAREGE